MGVWGRMRNRATRLGRLGPSAHGASVTVVVVPAERLKRVHARLRRAMARRAGTHTPQPLASSMDMGPGSALATLAWPGRQCRDLLHSKTTMPFCAVCRGWPSWLCGDDRG